MRSRNPAVRERALENMRAYYHRNKKPVQCECGRIIEGGRMDKHLRSDIHSLLMNPPIVLAGPSRDDFLSFFGKSTDALPHCPDR